MHRLIKFLSRCERSPRAPSKFLESFVFCFLLSAVACDEARAEDELYSEYTVKAAFVYNFFKFIEFPPAVLTQNTQLCVKGPDHVSRLFYQLNGKRLESGLLEVKPLPENGNLATCHAVFIARTDPAVMDKILLAAREHTIVTIGESEKFIRSGGLINFFGEAGKVRFEINLEAAEKAGIKMSSKLLKLGRVVNSDGVTVAP